MKTRILTHSAPAILAFAACMLATGAGASDADCRQRGQDSLVIVYAREGGATADRQIDEINRKSVSASRKAAERQLVEDVYRQRGTSSQVRSRIEAECMKEKEDKAKAAALADALMKSGARLEPAPPAAGTAPASPGAQPGVQPRTTSDADSKQKSCDRLRSDLARINSQQRAGGSGATMDRLRERERETAEQIRTGC